MKLGILDAVPPEFRHVDDHISDAAKFIDLLTAVELKAEWMVYNVAAGEFPASVAVCDAYIITGSPAGVHDGDLWIERLMAFVRAAHRRQIVMVGICFGHQVIAQALGGTVSAAPNGWHLGLLAVDVLAQPAWMTDDAARVMLYHINHDQVVQLPPDAQLLGRSDACPNSMFTIGDHILCLQGHPEQPLRAMKNFIAELGSAVPPEVTASALRSFEDGEPDYMRVGRWLRAFIERPSPDASVSRGSI